MCGGDLDIVAGTSIIKCKYCDTTQTIPKVTDDNLQNLFNRANVLRMKSEFDKAEKIYEKIIEEDSEQSEAYWGLILCKYGIEYVDDPETSKKIPTCHRASYDSIIADDDYKSAIEYADESQREVYEEQAREIDRIQKDILALAQNEETYDVFICYKETDSEGQRTQDSVIANDIYYQLTESGFKVFYAAITLEGKLGSEYEPIIFAALNSAKVMLAIGTKPEYFNAVWVKNEWSRFLKIIKKDRSKALIPCYRNMDAYELPEEFAHLQAQDMSKIGFINDIVRGIKKVVPKEEPKPQAPSKETNTANTNNVSIASLLKRVFLFLEDGDWNSANEYCEKVLDIDPENAQAYLGKLLVELRVKNQVELANRAKPFDNNKSYQKAVRFADEKLKKTLTGYINHINTRNENERLESIYNQATYAMKAASNEEEYKKVAEIFNGIRSYKDSSKLAETCIEKADLSYKEAKRKKKIKNITTISIISILIFAVVLVTTIIPNGQYAKAVSLMAIGRYSDALSIFESLDGYKDCDDKINECKIALLDDKYDEAVSLLNSGKYSEAMSLFESLEGHKDSADQIKECKYRHAIDLMNAGNVIEAYEMFISLDGYKDSAKKATLVYSKYKAEKFKNAKIGDYVTFGSYEQDGIASNGQEEIEWLVLDVVDGKALVISRYALDCKQYNTTDSNVTWETSSIRNWLNKEFLNSAFAEDERLIIAKEVVTPDKNTDYGTDSGNATLDQIFLLSIIEAKKYLKTDSDKACKPTAYAVENGTFVYSSSGNCWWLLRTPGKAQNMSAIMMGSNVSAQGYSVNSENAAIRPAMWVELDP